MPVNGIYRPHSKRSLLLEESLLRKRDRPFWTAYICVYKALIISIILISISPYFAKSQIINELCFEELVVNFLSKDERKISSYSGFKTGTLSNKIDTVTGAPYQLMIEDPEINFENLPGPYFSRSIVATLIFQDSTNQVSTLSLTDTLHRSRIREVRKTDYQKLRGTDPRFVSKYLSPGLLVAAGISGIISLFYIRSS